MNIKDNHVNILEKKKDFMNLIMDWSILIYKILNTKIKYKQVILYSNNLMINQMNNYKLILNTLLRHIYIM